jgi:TRAP-type C4-dicarboxylate transport system permease small subunit
MKKMREIMPFFEGPLTKAQLVLAGAAIVMIMMIEFINAIGRKLLIPFPCCLEFAESFMIVIVFMGIGYVALSEGHVQVTILTRKMRPSLRRYLDAAAYASGTVTFGLLAYGACLIAWNSTLLLEIRIGVFHFPIWIFRILFALGLSLMTLQCLINTVKFFRQASDPHWKPEEDVIERR